MARRSQFASFYLEQMLFGVEVEKVQEILRYQEMTPVPLAPPVVQGLINLRGQIVTALNLRCRLNLPDAPAEHLPMNVVLRHGDGAVSLLVDDIGDVLDLDESSFEPPPETLRGEARELIHGAYKLKDRLMLVLDTEKTLSLSGGGVT